jgi:hypothetical protein
MFAFVYNRPLVRTAMVKKLLRLAFYFLPLIVFLAMPKEPRVAASAPSPRIDSPPLKVAIFKSNRGHVANPARVSVTPLASQSGRPTAREVREVKAYVRTQAVQHGVDPLLALWIVKHESSFNPRAKGDGEASRGLWQISKIYHPEVSDDEAFGVRSSTDWSMQRLQAGKANEWSSYRNCKVLYSNCPY